MLLPVYKKLDRKTRIRERGYGFSRQNRSHAAGIAGQAIMLLQERRLERLGGNEAIDIDCRIIAAGSDDFLQLNAQEGSTKICITVSTGSVLICCVWTSAVKTSPCCLRISCRGLHFACYQWPVSQWSLESGADGAVAGQCARIVQLREAIGGAWLCGTYFCRTGRCIAVASVDAFEKMLIADVLARSNGTVVDAADRLGISGKTLYDKIRKYQSSASRTAE
jgi:two-component system C4-dicarboxylate transport response regulator DctD